MQTQLLKQIQARHARVAVIGLGYVGLPLAVESARSGFHVRGIEQRVDRLERARSGHSYILDVADAELSKVVAQGRFETTDDYRAVADADVILICVPTPLDKNKNPDTRHIAEATAGVVPFLRPGKLLILESTSYPGTTEEVIKPQLDALGLRIGTDLFLAFSPERVDPGNPTYKLKSIPKVVGGVTASCSQLAAAFYTAALGVPILTVSSPRAAEMTKLLENVFRVVNVSLMNELAILCDKMELDIWEVIEAARTKPFGYMPFYPGPGMGGHCIPVDAFYLSWKAKEYDVPTRFIELAGEINDSMPEYVVRRIAEILNDEGKPLRHATVLLLGMAYKRNVDDVRESPAVKIAELLLSKGADVLFHDPFVPSAQIGGKGVASVPLTRELLRRADLVTITTDHSNVDYALVAEHARSIFDTRGVLKGPAGATLYRLGGGQAGRPSARSEE